MSDFVCVVCGDDFESELVPARDLRTGGYVCEGCEEERKSWRERIEDDCSGDCGYHVHGWEA